MGVKNIRKDDFLDPLADICDGGVDCLRELGPSQMKAMVMVNVKGKTAIAYHGYRDDMEDAVADTMNHLQALLSIVSSDDYVKNLPVMVWLDQ